MKQNIGYFCIVMTLVILAACSVSSSDNTIPQATTTATGAIVKPNLAQTQSVPVNVLTNRYNNSRSGENLNETVLNQANVNINQFGKLFARKVEGDIYAQPLYVQGIEMPDQQKHNVVYIATMRNMVYAFDADDPAQSDPLWKHDLDKSFTENVFFDIPGGEVGILSTPVIDLTAQTMFLVTRNSEKGHSVYKLHALDIKTGLEKSNSPVKMDLSVRGSGLDNVNGIVHLNSDNQLQRTGLLLLNGQIFFGFGSNNDQGDWFGWIVAYDAATLKQLAIMNTSPNGYQGGIWMGGSGIATDGEFLYLVVANGVNTVANGGKDYGMSILKLKFDGKFKVADYYMPNNYDQLTADDSGLGSTGLILLPNTTLMVAGGKDGNLYVVDQKKLGGYDRKAETSLQIISFGGGGMFVTPVVWDSGPNGKPTVYGWNIQDTLRAFNVNTQIQQLVAQPASESILKSVGRPTGGLAISANGTDTSTGILWVTYAPDADQNAFGRGELVAFDATNLKRILWYSDQNKERDTLGVLSKFASPTIANGKVYVPTFSDELVVYGLLNTSASTN
ncbi:MAG: hypothetical protein H0X30_06960 [Anaerolineae bacterium]|nr:hypothetical protein [Anaerolineae bacterium]